MTPVVAQFNLSDLAQAVNALGIFQAFIFVFVIVVFIWNAFDSRKTKVTLEGLKIQTANIALAGKKAEQERGDVAAYLRLVENTVAANTDMAKQIPDALNLIREQAERQLESWQRQSSEMLAVVQGIGLSTKEAFQQFGSINERYSAIQQQGAHTQQQVELTRQQVELTRELIADINRKLDNLTCADKDLIKAAIHEVETERMTSLIKPITDEIPEPIGAKAP